MTSTREALAAYWPLFGLRLTTPRLVLTPMAEDDLVEMLELVLGGIHPADAMPFSTPWTDAPSADLIPNTLRHWWTQRGSATPEHWSVPFAVRIDGTLTGVQDLMGRAFAVRRLVSSGSWLGKPHQGAGIGTEMRSAVLQFAFDELGATRAESGAFVDNPASLRVSEKLGYQPNGTAVHERRSGQRAIEQQLTLTPETFVRPEWTVAVDGFAACRGFFGL